MRVPADYASTLATGRRSEPGHLRTITETDDQVGPPRAEGEMRDEALSYFWLCILKT
jgi:hypothetical protein